jgi:hypothetical protein
MTEFGCAVLLSILVEVPDLLEQSQPAIARVPPGGKTLFYRPDFGQWINLGRTLAKALKQFMNDMDQRSRVVEACGPASALMARLSENDIWDVLDRARHIRNQRSHGGVVSTAIVASWLAGLETLLSEAERAIADGFDGIELARVEAGRMSAGIYTYSRAQRLRGPNNVFQEFQLRSRVGLDAEKLVIVVRDVTVSPVLQIVPLVRLGPVSTIGRNAGYFLSSYEGGNDLLYVSYHFEDDPERLIQDPELAVLLTKLAQRQRGTDSQQTLRWQR